MQRAISCASWCNMHTCGMGSCATCINLPGCLASFQLSLRLVVQLAHVNHGRVPGECLYCPTPAKKRVLQVVVQRVHLRYDILLRERARLHGLHRRHVLLL